MNTLRRWYLIDFTAASQSPPWYGAEVVMKRSCNVLVKVILSQVFNILVSSTSVPMEFLPWSLQRIVHTHWEYYIVSLECRNGLHCISPLNDNMIITQLYFCYDLFLIYFLPPLHLASILASRPSKKLFNHNLRTAARADKTLVQTRNK